MNTSLARWMMGLVDEYKLNGRTLRSFFLHSWTCTLKTRVTCSLECLEWQTLTVINSPDRGFLALYISESVGLKPKALTRIACELLGLADKGWTTCWMGGPS